MKTFLLIAISLLGCASAPEDTGSQDQDWFNQCHQENVFPITQDGQCANYVHFWCDDGNNQYLPVPALASNWIGTTCYQDETNNYVYVCLVDHNQAVVRCNK